MFKFCRFDWILPIIINSFKIIRSIVDGSALNWSWSAFSLSKQTWTQMEWLPSLTWQREQVGSSSIPVILSFTLFSGWLVRIGCIALRSSSDTTPRQAGMGAGLQASIPHYLGFNYYSFLGIWRTSGTPETKGS